MKIISELSKLKTAQPPSEQKKGEGETPVKTPSPSTESTGKLVLVKPPKKKKQLTAQELIESLNGIVLIAYL